MSTRDAAAANPVVLHWAGRLTDEVFSFLGPASADLLQAGLGQTVILVDEPRYRDLLPRFERSVSLILTPALGNPCAMWRRAHASFVHALRRLRPRAVHLHGTWPYLLGSSTIWALRLEVPVYYSPHGSSALAASKGRLRPLLRVARRMLFGPRTERAIVNASTDARALSDATRHPVALIESPAAAAYFEATRAETPHPLIVTGSRIPDPERAGRFAQLAVLMDDAIQHLHLAWIGRGSDARCEACLKAAGVTVLDVADARERARRLGAAWIFVAPAGKGGFPVFLAEAMAVGLPCVAFDTPYHRDLIADGVSGYLCRDESEMLAQVARLVDSADLRRSIGAAARFDASRRFSRRRFREALRSSYAARAGSEAR